MAMNYKRYLQPHKHRTTLVGRISQPLFLSEIHADLGKGVEPFSETGVQDDPKQLLHYE